MRENLDILHTTSLFHVKLYYCSLQFNVNGSLTKHGVKMAGYWQNSFFTCLWTETELRSLNSHKKEGEQYQAILTKQASSMKTYM